MPFREVSVMDERREFVRFAAMEGALVVEFAMGNSADLERRRPPPGDRQCLMT
jgi:hypothetical protein